MVMKKWGMGDSVLQTGRERTVSRLADMGSSDKQKNPGPHRTK